MAGNLCRYRQLLTVILFLAILFAAFEFSGLREQFSLDFLRCRIFENKLGGLLIFVLLFCLGNLIQIPGWLFLAATPCASWTAGLRCACRDSSTPGPFAASWRCEYFFRPCRPSTIRWHCPGSDSGIT